jgi:4,5-DOPA dioxygenase extradiol
LLAPVPVRRDDG